MKRYKKKFSEAILVHGGPDNILNAPRNNRLREEDEDKEDVSKFVQVILKELKGVVEDCETLEKRLDEDEEKRKVGALKKEVQAIVTKYALPWK